jgi:transposase
MKELNISDRNQLKMASLDMMVAQDSTARVIDCFLDFAMDSDLGFKVNDDQRTGRPSYPERTLLGIFIYGYLNKLRSSRELQKACEVNVELWWLIHEHKPCYKTIANFRKDNNAAFKKLFVVFRTFCKRIELYGKNTVAIDGTKLRAQNSKKNNFNIKKVNQHLDYIANQEEYLNTLEQQDDIDEKLASIKARKDKYENLKNQLEESDETQISTTDPDARALPLHMNIVEVGYNIQSSVDDKHNLIVAYDVTNVKDNDALTLMAIKSKKALDLAEEDSLTVLADKGYFKGEQIHQCHKNNIDTLVAPRFYVDKNKAQHVRKDKFVYEENTNRYTCPNGKILSYQATYKRRKSGKEVSEFDRYAIRYSECKACPYFKDCVTPSQQRGSQGRTIDRSPFETSVEKNNEQIEARRVEYKRRQAIVEHPFGTIKRQWGMYYTLMKTKPKVETEVTIIFLCYNLRRVMSILGQEGLKMALKRVGKWIFTLRRSIEYGIVKIFFSKWHTPHQTVYFSLN